MNFIDMFCGMGTMRMGFEQAGHECVYSIEWDKHKRRIYDVIFRREPEGQDIRTVRGVDIPRADCWCFGAPCQDFSVAGKREGLEGDRSSLVREVFRLIGEIKEEYRPKYLLYENVKGMLSSNKGFDFLEILIEMESLGYDRIEYSLLNSKDFGVPQNRERVYTIGHLRGRSGRKVFPIGKRNEQVTNAIISFPQGYRTATTDGLSFCLGANGGGQGAKTGLYLVGKIKDKGNEMSCRVYDAKGIARTQMGTGGSHDEKTGLYFAGNRVRRLTPKETMRLQGVSDTVTNKLIAAGISDSQLYRAAGDACTVNVVYEIAKCMS